MNYISYLQNTNELWTDIIESSDHAANDGSFFPTSQTDICAYIILTRDGFKWTRGGSIIPGRKDYQDPYRSELSGQICLAAVISVSVIPAIVVACKRETDINQVNMDINYK